MVANIYLCVPEGLIQEQESNKRDFWQLKHHFYQFDLFRKNMNAAPCTYYRYQKQFQSIELNGYSYSSLLGCVRTPKITPPPEVEK